MIDNNNSPYYDDFDATKNFYQMLFRPGNVVQARELSQIQSLLQNQVSSFADHIFEDGIRIKGGEITLDSEVTYVKLDPTYAAVAIDVDDFDGTFIVGATSGARARVIAVADTSGSDPHTLMVKMLTGDSATTASAFTDGEDITTETTAVSATLISSAATGTGYVASINEGIFYIDGYFVRIEPQTLIVEKYSNTPTYRIGLTYTNTIITSDDDSSLLDPSLGSENFQAPGADRMKLSLTLSKKVLTFTDDVENASAIKFVELLRLENGIKTKENRYDVYSALEDTLAKRTYDESGNYEVKPFIISTDNHPSDTTKLQLSIQPGSAYIKGYEFRTISTEYVDIDKARTTQTDENREINGKFGNYCLVSNVANLFDVATLEEVDLLDDTVTNITNQTQYDAAKIGTANVRHFSYSSGTSPRVYKMYLFNIVTDSDKEFANVKSIWSTSYATGNYCDIDTTGQDGSGNAVLFSTGFNSLLFPAPQKSVSTLKPGGVTDTDFTTQRVFKNVTFTAGVAAINESGNNTFFGGSGALTDTIKNTHYTVVMNTVSNAGSTGYATGDYPTFLDAASRTITLSGGDQTATFDINDGVFAGIADIICTVNLNLKSEKVKTSNATTVSSVSLTSGVGDLAISDVYEIVEIRDTGDSDAVVTSSFTLNTGQKDNYYDHASIVLNSGASVVGPFDVDINYFSHSGTGYFSVDSYPIDYEDIPSYTSPTTGSKYRLTDVIDFRPRRTDGATTFDSAATGIDLILPNTNLDADYEFYLSRIDKLVLTSDRKFRVIAGVPALKPIQPPDDADSMTLATIYVPAYTFNRNEVIKKRVDNKRFTMRDIAGLAKRIKNIEYYTSLSMLETETKDMLILDSSGANRFKNGILVDTFVGHNIGDVANPDYACSMHKQAGLLLPSFTVDSIDFTLNTGNSLNVSKTGSLIHADFTEADFVKQVLASKSVSVNKFNVTTFIGSMALDPQTDDWMDTTVTADVSDNNNNVNDDWASGSGYGSDYLFWKLIWNGIENSMEQQTYHWGSTLNIYAKTLGELGTEVRDAGGSYKEQLSARNEAASAFYGYQNGQYAGSSGILEAERVFFDFVSGNYTASTNNASSTSIESNNRLIDANIIPYIRAKTVTFTVTGMKPSTRVYPFFDNTDVTAYVTPSGGSLGDPVYTDTNGSVTGTLAIPGGTFRTGDRLFRLIDSSSNDTTASSTIAEMTYSASGLLLTKDGGVTSTRPVTTVRQVQDSNQFGNTLNRDNVTSDYGGANWADPVAQTIYVDKKVYPNGVFITSTKLYFKTKDDTLPVRIQIRPTVNGIPHSNAILPFSEVTKQSSAVNISETGTSATTFTFPSPIYLEPGQTYALAIVSDSSDYEVFVAEMGQTVLDTDNNRITKQPYIGSFFASQNGTTWAPELNTDLKFEVMKADFTDSTPVEAHFDNVLPTSDVYFDVISIMHDSLEFGTAGNITWYYKRKDNTTSTMDTSWTQIPVGNDLPETAQKIVNSGTADTLLLRAVMTGTDDVFPVIDIERLSAKTIRHIINNDSTNETDASGGNATAKYITRRVILKDGLEADSLRVYLTADRPSGTSLQVYYKVLSNEDSTDFDDRPWVLMTEETDSTKLSTDTRLIELAYSADSITYDGYTDFKIFAIKVVMLSSNTSVVPYCRDIRALAVT